MVSYVLTIDGKYLCTEFMEIGENPNPKGYPWDFRPGAEIPRVTLRVWPASGFSGNSMNSVHAIDGAIDGASDSTDFRRFADSTESPECSDRLRRAAHYRKCRRPIGVGIANRRRF